MNITNVMQIVMLKGFTVEKGWMFSMSDKNGSNLGGTDEPITISELIYYFKSYIS